MNRVPSSSRALEVAVSIVVHVVVIAVPVFLSLIYTDTLNLRAYTATLIVGPPPPPPPPPAPVVQALAKTPRRVFTVEGKLIAPTFIPKQVAEIKEAPLPEEADFGGVAGGVPGGVPGGQMGGVIGGVIGGILGSNVRPSVPIATSAPKAPIRVGGRVKPPRAIFQPPPVYPTLAKHTRIQGQVVLEAIVDEQGNVVDAKVVSGHPLLIQAALDVVRKWKYEPTYLNDQPVAIQMNVIVTFELR